MPNIIKTKVLYMPSTPLNILVCVAHAFANRETQNSQIILIDQKEVVQNKYFDTLQAWNESPFEKVFITPGVEKGLAKLRERKQNFKVLESILEHFTVDAIAVGSDRRVEFQYLMHLGQKANKNLEGWYMDDGLYSYSGRPKVWYKDLFNSLIKKVIYGFWWKEPKTVGASDWINQAWLFSPENAVEPIQNKVCHQILTEWFLTPDASEFVNLVLDKFGVDVQMRMQLESTDLFILIPHPNNILKMDGYLQRLELFLEEAMELGKKVAVKYHPRSNGPDYLGLEKRYSVLVLPNNLAFEFMMPLLDSDTIILGDVSTVLMTAKWLRPDIKSLAVLNEEDFFAQQFKGIIEKLGISIISSFDAAFRLL